jgi:hypothetical protein
MEASEIRRQIVVVEQNAFRACQACAGSVGHDPNVGIICARDPKVEDCGLLAVNGLRSAENPEALLEQMTEDWAMSFVRPKNQEAPAVPSTDVATGIPRVGTDVSADGVTRVAAIAQAKSPDTIPAPSVPGQAEPTAGQSEDPTH